MHLSMCNINTSIVDNFLSIKYFHRSKALELEYLNDPLCKTVE